jgi:hypothetical protein
MQWKVPYGRMVNRLKNITPACAAADCSRRYPLMNGWIQRDGGLRTQDGDWFCSPDCFERGMTLRLEQLPISQRPPRMNRIPLGLLLHKRGVITTEQLNLALDEHRRSGMKLGQCLRRKYDIPEGEIAGAIAAQWSCPTFPTSEIAATWIGLLPLRLIERYRILPVRLVESTRRLYVGCSERVPYDVLYAMERILELRTEPCIISDSAFASQLQQHSNAAAANDIDDIVVESMTSPAEVARMTRGYAQQLQADEVRYALCGSYIWLRVRGRRHRMNLLYRPWGTAAMINPMDFRTTPVLTT